MLLLLVELLNLFQLLSVCLENYIEFGVQVAFQAFALKDALKLSQESQRVLNGSNALKTLIDELLQRGFQVSYLITEKSGVSILYNSKEKIIFYL